MIAMLLASTRRNLALIGEARVMFWGHFEMGHSGIPRNWRDTTEAAYDAARFSKSRFNRDITELFDRSTGSRVIMFDDSRTG